MKCSISSSVFAALLALSLSTAGCYHTAFILKSHDVVFKVGREDSRFGLVLRDVSANGTASFRELETGKLLECRIGEQVPTKLGLTLTASSPERKTATLSYLGSETQTGLYGLFE